MSFPRDMNNLRPEDQFLLKVYMDREENRLNSISEEEQIKGEK